MIEDTPARVESEVEASEAPEVLEAPAVTTPEGGDVLNPEGLLKLMWRTFSQNKLALVSVGVLLFMVLFCFVGPYVYRTQQVNSYLVVNNPVNYPWFHSLQFPLGTDPSGFNILGRLMYGGKSALIVGLLAGVISTFFGAIYGAIAGYRGGWLDAVLMRGVDTGLSIPQIFLLIAIITAFGASVTSIVLTLSFTGWFGSSRLIRGETLSLRTREYVMAVRAMGGTNRRIILRHILPNAVGTMVVIGTFAVADSILALTTLGFLGLGLHPPQTDWGTMLNNGVSYLANSYWWEIVPAGMCIVIVILTLNYIGDALRDAFETRLLQR